MQKVRDPKDRLCRGFTRWWEPDERRLTHCACLLLIYTLEIHSLTYFFQHSDKHHTTNKTGKGQYRDSVSNTDEENFLAPVSVIW